jgi:hypothetical protein
MVHGRASLDVLKVALGIELEVDDIIAQLWRGLPGNSTIGVHETHRITSGFELAQNFRKSQATGRMDAITPEAGGFNSSLSELFENVIHTILRVPAMNASAIATSAGRSGGRLLCRHLSSCRARRRRLQTESYFTLSHAHRCVSEGGLIGGAPKSKL